MTNYQKSVNIDARFIDDRLADLDGNALKILLFCGRYMDGGRNCKITKTFLKESLKLSEHAYKKATASLEAQKMICRTQAKGKGKKFNTTKYRVTTKLITYTLSLDNAEIEVEEPIVENQPPEPLVVSPLAEPPLAENQPPYSNTYKVVSNTNSYSNTVVAAQRETTTPPPSIKNTKKGNTKRKTAAPPPLEEVLGKQVAEMVKHRPNSDMPYFYKHIQNEIFAYLSGEGKEFWQDWYPRIKDKRQKRCLSRTIEQFVSKNIENKQKVLNWWQYMPHIEAFAVNLKPAKA